MFPHPAIRAILLVCNSVDAAQRWSLLFIRMAPSMTPPCATWWRGRSSPALIFWFPAEPPAKRPRLSHDEWLHVIDTTIEVVAGRVPIVAGATSNSTHDAVEKAKEVAARPGVNAILTASPYYNKPTQEGQYRHFKAIAEAVATSRSFFTTCPAAPAANLEPATLARLAEIPNIVGVKEASGNMTQIAEAINAGARDIFWFFPETMRSPCR